MIKKTPYIFIGILLAIAGTVFASQISVPSGNGSGFLLQSLSSGNYNPVSLTAGSNITISTTTSSITISGLGGTFPFTAQSYGVSTSTTVAFLNGLFSTASSTFSGNFFLSALGNGLLKTSGGTGAVSVASNGTDYTLITAKTCSAGQHVNDVTAAGVFSCTADSGSGGGSFPFAASSNFNQVVYATSTPTLWFQSGLFASSTSQFDNSTTTFASIKNLWLPNITTKTLSVDTSGLVYGTATSTPTVTAPITYSGTLGQFIGGVSGAFDCTSATGSVKGCLTNTDWTTFNNKLTSYDAWTHPYALHSATTSTLVLSGGAVVTASTTFTGVATTSFNGGMNVLIGDTQYGFATGAQPLEISGTVNLPYQSIISNKSTGGNALSGYTLANANTSNTANPFADVYYGGMYMAGSGFNLYPGLQPNDLVVVNSDAQVNIASLSSTTGAINFAVNPGFTMANYDARLLGIPSNGTAALLIGTTTGLFPVTALSTTTSQFGLSNGTGIAQWVMRNAGGNLYVATTTVLGTATSTMSAFNVTGSTGNFGIATDTPGSLFSLGTTGGINFLPTATSTFGSSANGINIKNGCFAINGTCVGGSAFSNTIANGGTGSTAFSPNSIITSNSAGTALIATGTQLTVGNLVATTTANNTFAGNILAPLGLVGSPSHSFNGDTDTGMYSTAANNVDFATNGVWRMGISAGGFVGIATTTPLYQLGIASSTGPQLSLSDSAGLAQWTFRNAGGNFYLSTTTVDGTATTSTSALTLIGSSGFMGLGTSSPDNSGDLLTIWSPSSTFSRMGLNNNNINSGTSFRYYNGSTLGGAIVFNNNNSQFEINGESANSFETFKAGGLERLRITAGGFAAFGTTTVTNLATVTVASSTKPQLSLGDALTGDGQWVFRNAGGNLFFATTTAIGTATTSISAFNVTGSNGNFGIATDTPGTRLSIQGVANFHTATSTFQSTGGLNLTSGCFAINSVCVGAGGSGTVTSVANGTGLGGGTITTSGTISLLSYLATSTGENNGQLAYWTTTNGTPAKLGKVATTSETCTSPLSCTAHDVLTGGGAISLNTVPIASGGTNSTALSLNGLMYYNGTSILATSTQPLYVGSLYATTTALSTFTGPTTFGTTSITNLATVTIASSTKPQLFLGDATAGTAQWTLRSSGANLYFSTTTAVGNATTSSAAATLCGTATCKPGVAISSSTPFATLSVNPLPGDFSAEFAVGSSSRNDFYINNSGQIFAPNTTSSGSNQTGYWCYDANGQLIRDTVICVAVSALRFKTNIQPLTVGLDELLKLRPVSYKLKSDYNTLFANNPNYNGVQYSLIADEVQKIDPHLVIVETATTTFEGKTYAPGTVHGLADVNNWIGLFTKSIQDLYGQFQKLVARVSGLEKKVEDQQTKIDSLQAQIDAINLKLK